MTRAHRSVIAARDRVYAAYKLHFATRIKAINAPPMLVSDLTMKVQVAANLETVHTVWHCTCTQCRTCIDCKRGLHSSNAV